MPISLEVGSDIVRNYKRLSYKPWYALAEFVDNSTQSYFNNREVLDKAFAAEAEKLRVTIVYDHERLRIHDNSIGMSRSELANALRLGRPPGNINGRSQFGLGLKTAACWFGNKWSVTTKKMGELYEYTVEVDVEAVAEGNKNLPSRRIRKEKSLHYTIVEIWQLHSALHGRTVGKVKEFLRSMYRVDLRAGDLELLWDDAPLIWKDQLEFMKRRDGTPYRRNFEFQIGSKKVEGWLGVLGPGSSGRPNAGFTILRRGRVIQGFPAAWRSQTIFGQLQGSNDLINQRIAGEIFLDEFEVSHTKDDILWIGNEEDEIQDKLKELATDYISIAKSPRKRGDKRGPSEAEVQAAVDELKSEMQSAEFVDLIEIETVPPPEIIALSNRQMVEGAKAQEPQFSITVGTQFKCLLYLAVDASPMELYYQSEVDSDQRTLSVVINLNHPHWSQLGASESVLTYLRQCVYDAISEWQCRRKTGTIQPDTIKALKDGLLRLPSTIEDHS